VHPHTTHPRCADDDDNEQNQITKDYYAPYYEATEAMFIKPRKPLPSSPYSHDREIKSSFGQAEGITHNSTNSFADLSCPLLSKGEFELVSTLKPKFSMFKMPQTTSQ
jgi:hypothetical protein